MDCCSGDAGQCGSGVLVGRVRQPPRRGADRSAASDAGSPPAALPSPVEEYIQFVATAGDSRSGLSDDQMAEGLRKLAGALGTLNAGGPDLLIDLRVGAEHVLLNPAATETAAIIREAMVTAADAIEREKRTGPGAARSGSICQAGPAVSRTAGRRPSLLPPGCRCLFSGRLLMGSPSAARSVRQPEAFAPISRL